MDATKIGSGFNHKQYRSLDESINQESKYEEKEVIEGLTLYDIHRQPRALVTDTKHTIELNVEELNAELTCPVCLSIMNNTHTTPKCLHRFCLECIKTSIRLCKNECPSCRVHLPSHRYLREDDNFNQLIRTIYPDLSKYEEEKAEEIAASNLTLNQAMSKGMQQGMEEQQAKRKTRRKKSFDQEQEDEDASDMIDFTLARDPYAMKLPKLEREHLRCSNQVQVKHLKEYLQIKLDIPMNKLNVFVLKNNRRTSVTLDSKLQDIQKNFPFYEGEMQLWYN